MVMPYHLHMPSYFLETFTEYPFLSTVYNPGIPLMQTATYLFCILWEHLFLSV